jgi:ATP-dependent RNA helicase RhlE
MFMSFDTLGLAPELARAVADEGYTEPTPVQRQAIPLVLAGRDVLAGAQTGTGKTAAFVLPMLQLLHIAGPARRGLVRALVLAPTRELALQVEESFRTYGRHRPLRSVAIYGGVGFEPQVRALRAGPPIVVATPGRLLDHVEQRTIDLARVEILVLDEADRMLDMGFIRDIGRILALLPARRQNLLFSATFSDEIRSLAAGLLDRPATVDVSPRVTAAELVDQLVIPVDRHRKRELLSHLVHSGRVAQALVFTRTKHGANRLAEQLVTDGIRAAAIHGNKSQGQRVRALADFKAGRVELMVATDIAARGLDIEALPHVVNFELPMVPADYVHRIGRTGRAGVDGQAISLVCVDEAQLLRDVQAFLRRTLPSEVVHGFEPDRSLRAEPIRLRSVGAARGVRAAPAAGRSPGGARRRATSRPASQPTARAVHGSAPAPGRRGLVALPGERLSRGGAASVSAPSHRSPLGGRT